MRPVDATGDELCGIEDFLLRGVRGGVVVGELAGDFGDFGDCLGDCLGECKLVDIVVVLTLHSAAVGII